MIAQMKKQLSWLWLDISSYICTSEKKITKQVFGSLFGSRCRAASVQKKPANYPIVAAELILQKYQEKKSPRILSIAGGNHRDLNKIQKWLKHGPTFTLYDHDHGALAHSKKILSEIRNRCEFIQGNILRIDREFQNTKPYDLVIMGELFDYIKDSTMSKILTFIWSELINEGGIIFFKNSLQDNSRQALTDYDGDWPAIVRNDEELIQLCTSAGIPADAVNIATDGCSRTIMVESKSAYNLH